VPAGLHLPWHAATVVNQYCRTYGHRFPTDHPSVFSRTPATPSVNVCSRCGLTLIIKADGSRQYIQPTESK
jgi:hypothetical protein